MLETYSDYLEMVSHMRNPGHGISRAINQVLSVPVNVSSEMLLKCTYEENLDLSCEALALLAKTYPPIANTRAVELLQSINKTQRWVGCMIIEEIASELSEIPIQNLLTTELDPGVRYAAVSSLGTVGTANSINLLDSVQAIDKSTDFEGRPIGELVTRVKNQIFMRCNNT